jgi:hypothetical protein
MARQYFQITSGAVILLALALAHTHRAKAQMALPGAVAPTPAGTVTQVAKPKSRGGGGMGEARVKAIMPKAPTEETILDKSLKRDGAGSEILITRAGTDFQVNKLVFVGDRLSRSGEQCRYEAPGAPLKLTSKESGAGLRRYQVDFPDCAFSFDVLDGAVLATNDGKICEIKSADCRIDPEGLWGMGETDFDPKTAGDMLGARAKVERTVRSNFRALYDHNKGDKALRAFIVHEQAGFSSWREEVCRSYAKESDFGYCALRLTEARVISLGAQLASGIKQPEEKLSAPGAMTQPASVVVTPASSGPAPASVATPAQSAPASDAPQLQPAATTINAPPPADKFTPATSPAATEQ